MISPVSSSSSAIAEHLQSAVQQPAAQVPQAAPSHSGSAYTVNLSSKSAAPVDVDHDGDSH